MISSLFPLQLGLTFIVGAIWIYLTVRASQRFGSKIGGFIGGLPSTALLSFFFIGLTQSPEIASKATTAFPLVYGATALFLVVFAWQAKKGFSWAILMGLTTWLVLSTLIAWHKPTNYFLIIISYLFVIMLAYYLLEFKLRISSIDKLTIKYTSKQTVIRSLFGALIILLAVLLAKLGGPVFGGIFAAFPAMFISTLSITYQVHGLDFSRALTKPLMVTGMITIVIYSVAVRYLYLLSGLYIGTLLSIIISGISAYFTYLFIQYRTK